MQIKNKNTDEKTVYFLGLFFSLAIFCLPTSFVLADDSENGLAQRSGEILVAYKKEKIDLETEAGVIKKNNLENRANVSEQEKITDTDPYSEKNPVIVADIDTGFDYTHPDLDSNNLWDGTLCKDEGGVFLGDCLYGYDFD